VLQNLSQRLSAIFRLGHDIQIWFVFQQPPQSLPHQDKLMRQNATNRLIVSDLCVGAHSSSYLVGKTWSSAVHFDDRAEYRRQSDYCTALAAFSADFLCLS
jgi:hypothetical protein